MTCTTVRNPGTGGSLRLVLGVLLTVMVARQLASMHRMPAILGAYAVCTARRPQGSRRSSAG